MHLSFATSLIPLAFTIVGAQPASASDLRMLETTEEETLDGESCLADVISRWKEENTPMRSYLESFMANNSITDGSGSNAYAVAKDACKDILAQNNANMGAHCLARKEKGIDWSYGKFWDQSIMFYQTGGEGGAFLKPEYNMASLLSGYDRPGGFFDLSPAEIPDTKPCLRDCYTSIGKGCDPVKAEFWYVEGGPQISAQEYCDLKVGPMDIENMKMIACMVRTLAPNVTTSNATKDN